MQITIGIDISKDTLDAYRLSDNQHIQVVNDKAGHKTLLRWIQNNEKLLVVFGCRPECGWNSVWRDLR